MSEKRKISKSDIAIIKWMWSLFHKERWHVIYLVISNVVAASLTIFYANYSKNIINAAAINHDKDLVVKYAFQFFLLIMFQLVLKLFSNSFTDRCKARIEVTLRKHILDTVLKKDYQDVTTIHTGEIQNRMTSDVTTISDGFTTILPSLVYYVVQLIVAFVYLIVIDKVFSFVFFVGGLLVLFFMTAFRKILKKLHKDVQESEGRVRSYIQEILTSMLVVKSFVVEEKVSTEAEELMEENYKIKMKRRMFSILANAGISTTFNLGYVFAIAFGAYRLIGGLDYGTVTAMLQLVNKIQQPFAALSGVIPRYFAILASSERIMELENFSDEKHENREDINVKQVYDDLQTIEFKDISFSYDRDIILDSTSLSVDKGDFVAIMGISGIGKSTLLKLLLGVFHTQSGDIKLKTATRDIPIDYHTRRLFSYVPQGNILLSGTIRENLTFINKEATDEEIYRAIKIACADNFIDELPDGIETVIGERGAGLSEGQLQRLAIARSILSKSPIMLLDEATSALDEATELQFLKNLKDMQDKTCIIVSHKTAALEICNKHIQIKDGKILVEAK